ncbi:hypothetical protein KKB18_08160 [bacterium]|nr:hypothetical protein [bacterium]
MPLSCVKKGCPGHLESAESVLSEKELAALLEILRASERYRNLKNSILLVCNTCKVYYVKSRR